MFCCLLLVQFLFFFYECFNVSSFSFSLFVRYVFTLACLIVSHHALLVCTIFFIIIIAPITVLCVMFYVYVYVLYVLHLRLLNKFCCLFSQLEPLVRR